MDSLPPEILCNIFMERLLNARFKRHYSSSESIPALLHITHVCRTWRHLSLSYCVLWSYLYLHLRRWKNQEVMVEVFDAWMARSNDGPLNFEVFICLLSGDASIEGHQGAEYILTTLIENQRRWKDMKIFCSGVSLSLRFPGFNLTNMPLLTSLELALDESLRSTADFTNSLRLRQLTIKHNNFNLLTDGRLSQLERVSLSLSTLLGLRILRNTPFMRCLSISANSTAPLSPIVLDGEPILHIFLNELSLLGEHGSVLPATIIDAVTLPSLQSLTYHNHIGNEKLLRFFQRSSPPLTRLCMRCKDSREETLIDILRLLPSLKDLRISYTKLSDWFFRELTVPGDISDSSSATREQIICPLLSYFAIRERATYGLDPLLTMAKSRASILGTFELASFYNFCSPSNHYVTKDRTVPVVDLDTYASVIDPGRAFTLR